MIHEFEKLTVKEIEQMFDAPVLVAILIACADGSVNEKEHSRALNIAHVKTFSEKDNLKEFYIELEKDFENRWVHHTHELTDDKHENVKRLSEQLSHLNHIFKKVSYRFAYNLYKSLQNFAVHIANAGGFITISEAEKHLIHLPMIDEPKQQV